MLAPVREEGQDLYCPVLDGGGEAFNGRPGRPAEGRDMRTDSGDCRSPWIDRVAWVSFLPG